MSQKFIYIDGSGDNTESEAFESSDFISTSAGAGDAGKPIVLDSGGQIDASMINDADIDHGGLSGLGDDDHTQYILVAGTRAFTGNQSLGSNKITSLADGVDPNDAVNKSQLDAVASGLEDYRDSVLNKDIVTPPGSPSTGDRYLIGLDPNAGSATGAWVGQDGKITEWNGSSWDFEAEPNSGTYVFVEDENSQYVFNNNTFLSGLWVLFNTGIYTGGDGIAISGSNEISVDFVAGSGLQITANQLDIQEATTFTINSADELPLYADDLANTSNGLGASIVGIEDSSGYYTGNNVEAVSNELEAQIGGTTSTTYAFTEDNVLADNDPVYAALNKLDLKWGDLASTANGEGASLVGIEDAGGNFTSTDVEGALAELAGSTAGDSNTYTVGTGGVTKGDLVYISANDTVVPYDDITVAEWVVGVAKTTESAASSVEVIKNDVLLDGFSSLTAGTKYYWNGDGTSNAGAAGWISTFGSFVAGDYVWIGGAARNATTVHVARDFLLRRA